MSEIYSVYRVADGQFTGRVIVVPDGMTPSVIEGLALKSGKHDKRTSMIDTQTLEVLANTSPDPAIERDDVLQQLSALEKKATRYVLESYAGTIDDEGRTRLAAIIEKRARLRSRLKPTGKKAAT